MSKGVKEWRGKGVNEWKRRGVKEWRCEGVHVKRVAICFDAAVVNLNGSLLWQFCDCYLLLLIQWLKLRFHLSIMRMRMTNVNVTNNWKHRISIGMLPFVRMRMQSTMTTKWIPSWAIGANANVLSDQKSLHTHGSHRVAHTSCRGKVHWSFNIIRHSYSSSYSH